MSVDTTYIDCYIDGKLVVSSPLSPDRQIVSSPSRDLVISFKKRDRSTPDIYLAKLTRWDHALDPQTVWNEYNSGTGLSDSNFKLEIAVTKDDTTNNYKIY